MSGDTRHSEYSIDPRLREDEKRHLEWLSGVLALSRSPEELAYLAGVLLRAAADKKAELSMGGES